MLKQCTLLVLAFTLFTTVGMAQENGWTTLTIGQSLYGIRYDQPGAVIVNNSLVMSCMPDSPSGSEAGLYVSRPSPLKKFVLVMCSKYADDEAYIIDTAHNQVVSRDVVPKHWSIIQWISWSPDERFALIAAAGEMTNGDMAFVDLQTGVAEEIHFKNFTNNPRIKQSIVDEVQDFDPDVISWISGSAFNLQLNVHCDPYENGDESCMTKILRSYPIGVNLSSFNISYGNSGQARTTRARKVSARNSQAGKGIRSVDFRKFTYTNGSDRF